MFHSYRFTLLTVINIPVTTGKTYYFRVNFLLVTLDYCGFLPEFAGYLVFLFGQVAGTPLSR